MYKAYIILFIVVGYIMKHLEDLLRIKNYIIQTDFLDKEFYILVNKNGKIKYRSKNFNNVLLYRIERDKVENFNDIIFDEDKKLYNKDKEFDMNKICVRIKCGDGGFKYFNLYIEIFQSFLKKFYYYKIKGEDINFSEQIEKYGYNEKVLNNKEKNFAEGKIKDNIINLVRENDINILKKKFSIFLDTLPIGIIEYNFENKKFNFNKNLLNMIKDSEKVDDIILIDILKKFDDIAYYRILMKLSEVLEKKENAYFKYLSKYHKEDKDIWLEIVVSYNVYENGKPFFMVIYVKDITDKKEIEDELKRLYYYDNITDLPNKYNFYYSVTRLLQLKSDRKSALIIASIDNINSIVEAYGYDFGDKTLITVSNRIKEISYNYYLCRFNFGKFAIFIANYKKEDDIKRYLDLLMDKISVSYKDNEKVEEYLKIGLSAGVALYPKDTKNIDNLINYADIAVNHAAEKNNYVFFTKYMNTKVKERAYLELELAKALEIKEQLKLYLQPQYSFSSGKLIGFEALARWENKDNSFISPDTFIPIAEKTGHIIPLGFWILRESCYIIKKMQEQGYKDIVISVNISGEQLKDSNILEDIESIICETGIKKEYLNLEITESILMENFDECYKKICELKRLGINISLDDFGKGYSSLSSLKDLPISELKIDKSFIENIENSEINRGIVNQIVMLANLLNIETVAEGIEIKEQYMYLKDIGCDYAQGYFCGYPVPKSEVFKILKDKFTLNIDK